MDVIMTRLRTSDGLNLDIIESLYGKETVHTILKGAQMAIDLKLATITHEVDRNTHRILKLSDPDGFLFSNTILSNIFLEFDQI